MIDLGVVLIIGTMLIGPVAAMMIHYYFWR
jgi:hypothetical protein